MKMSLEGRVVVAITLKSWKRKMSNFNSGNKKYLCGKTNYSGGLKNYCAFEWNKLWNWTAEFHYQFMETFLLCRAKKGWVGLSLYEVK